MSEIFIRMPEVLRRTTYRKAWIYRLISQGRFPQPVKIGSRSVAFIEREIDEWVNQRIAERDRSKGVNIKSDK
ncbi:helix-turn-helix transcriptional regulator [Atlantibacter hermannii]|uniref:helix-turn-helix transcriptional regulator n=1 Tax=Atlantibacter hermannii TaxID=565 RepID=UPI0019314800|nr:AlpA family transcriptional regulator [Atlantibacter hermannii]MBL7637999.1 AlpA family transcriptional regulator [Atlantibacter hermannii]MBL7676208.1 AlpA family transcriptional regulator [Atlantibacter hermannii]